METPRRVSGDALLQLGLECLAPLSPRRWIAYGVAEAPRGQPGRLSVTAGAGADCAIEHVAFHPDPAGSDASRARHRFTLVFAVPEGRQAEAVILTAAGATARADLRAPGLSADLAAATTARDWSATFALFAACASEPALAPLLQGSDHGVFANWLAALPALPGRAGKTGPFQEIEALCSPAGEFLLVLRGLGPLPAGTLGRMALAARTDGPGSAPRVLPLLDAQGGAHLHGLVLYGRVPAELHGRLHAPELLAEIESGHGQSLRLRAHPRLVAAPDFLDAASRLTASPGPQSGALALAGAALVQGILATREAAFAPLLAAAPWPSPPIGAPIGAPRTLALLNANDPLAARLFHVTAAAIEQRAERLLILGEAAEDIAAIFLRRGHLTVETGAAALARLRGATEGVIALEAAHFAEAVIADRLERAFAETVDAGALARLLLLHAVAGFSLDFDDSLARLLRRDRMARAGRGAEAALVPLMRAWSSPLAAERVHDHLARLWAGLPAATEASAHA
jgi:hypothetical protein